MSEPETMAEFRKLMIVDVSIETYNVEGLMVGHHHVFLVDMSHVGRYCGRFDGWSSSCFPGRYVSCR